MIRRFDEVGCPEYVGIPINITSAIMNGWEGEIDENGNGGLVKLFTINLREVMIVIDIQNHSFMDIIGIDTQDSYSVFTCHCENITSIVPPFTCTNISTSVLHQIKSEISSSTNYGPLIFLVGLAAISVGGISYILWRNIRR